MLVRNHGEGNIRLMTTSPAIAIRQRLTGVQWVICAMAALGFAFDTYSLLVLPLIVRPALMDLAKVKPGTPEFNYWVGMLFYIPAVAGGIFGLIGGYLTDRLGRRRILVWSILLYAFSALASGYVTSISTLLVLRCTTFIGVSVEFVAAVAWLAELFPDPKQREAVLGYTQAFSSLGGLMISAAYYLAVTYAGSLPAIHGGHEAWRYTLISGIIPAIPLMIVRPFLPESPVWKEKKAQGTLKRPSFAELFHPEYRKTTLLTALMFACSYGAAFGAIQHIPRIVPDRQPPAPPARVPGPGTVPGAVRLLLPGASQSQDGAGRHIRGGACHGGAVQLLGKLSAQGVSDAPSRHGRKLRGKYRRQDDRDFGRALDHATG